MIKRIKESVKPRISGFAVNYRDMGSGKHHLIKFMSKNDAVRVYNALEEIADQFNEGFIDADTYYGAVDELLTSGIDTEYEIHFRRDIDNNNVYTSPYDINGFKQGDVPTYWKIVNPTAVDLYVYESLREGKKKTSKKSVKKTAKKSSCKEQTLMEDSSNLVKITINTARKLFDAGETVYLLPNKVRLGNAWIFPFAVNTNNSSGHSFDNIINSYSYYNCNKEVGNSVAFYKEG